MKLKAIRRDTDGLPEADPVVDKTLTTLDAKLARAIKVLGDGYGLIPAEYVRVYRAAEYRVGDIIEIVDDLGVLRFAQIDGITPSVTKESSLSGGTGLKTTIKFTLLTPNYEST